MYLIRVSTFFCPFFLLSSLSLSDNSPNKSFSCMKKYSDCSKYVHKRTAKEYFLSKGKVFNSEKRLSNFSLSKIISLSLGIIVFE